MLPEAGERETDLGKQMAIIWVSWALMTACVCETGHSIIVTQNFHTWAPQGLNKNRVKK